MVKDSLEIDIKKALSNGQHPKSWTINIILIRIMSSIFYRAHSF